MLPRQPVLMVLQPVQLLLVEAAEVEATMQEKRKMMTLQVLPVTMMVMILPFLVLLLLALLVLPALALVLVPVLLLVLVLVLALVLLALVPVPLLKEMVMVGDLVDQDVHLVLPPTVVLLLLLINVLEL
jgi:hypothetical protein